MEQLILAEASAIDQNLLGPEAFQHLLDTVQVALLRLVTSDPH